MNRRWTMVAGAIVAASVAAAAVAQAAPATSPEKSVPKNWNYEIKDGKRVPKGNRVSNADGSWREEVRIGKCVTLKEKSAAGEYRESRSCDN